MAVLRRQIRALAYPIVPDNFVRLGFRGETDANCALLPSRIGQGYQVLSCEDGTAQGPTVFAISNGTTIIVNAFYPDNRSVSIQSWSANGSSPELDADDLRPAVTDPALADLLLDK